MSASKLILVIGATGAQGQAVVDALLAPDANGKASPYSVRALTRDPKSAHAQVLTARGVECVQGWCTQADINSGSFTDFDTVARALDGAYGAFVNTDGFTCGEMREILMGNEQYAGMRIFELAKQTRSLKHYVWSNLRHVSKRAGFDPAYRAEHMDAKGRVGEWLSVQESNLDGLSWSQVTTGPYMDMLKGGLYAPLNIRKDGTVVFVAPVEDGHIPMIALKDLGWWARWTFDHRVETSARELNVTSDRVTFDDIVKTFTKVTGQPAVYKRVTMDEWFDLFDAEKMAAPVANELRRGDGSTTLRENFTRFWSVMRDDIIDKDMEWIRSVHPGTYTLERWMRDSNYDGRAKNVLKNSQDGKNPLGLKAEAAALL
ncbi:NAD(P)-binding protein [Mycena crocata]|nr:NAD(P)-binding protein [Mycena crocata]